MSATILTSFGSDGHYTQWMSLHWLLTKWWHSIQKVGTVSQLKVVNIVAKQMTCNFLQCDASNNISETFKRKPYMFYLQNWFSKKVDFSPVVYSNIPSLAIKYYSTWIEVYYITC